MKVRFQKNKAHRCVILAVIISVSLAKAAFGNDTGWQSAKLDSIAPTSEWKTPEYVMTCDSNYAHYSGLDTGDTLYIYNYSFALPVSAIIDSLWYKYTGYGSGNGAENIVKIGFMAGASRNLCNEFHLPSAAADDSASITVFSRDTINAACVNSTSFGLYAVTAGDQYLTNTYIDCAKIRIFYRESASLARRQKLINNGEE